jgi:hypothetical protein
MVTRRSKQKKGLLRPALLISAVLVATGLGMFALELTNTTHVFHHQKPQSKGIVSVGDPVAPPSQSSQNPASGSSDDRNFSPGQTQGGATDTHGSASTTTDSSQWVISENGYITVRSPLANTKLKDGSVVAGTAKVDQVSYRLTDNTVGVVAQGQLGVVDGKFSGSLHFTPKGTGGRLDVFSTDTSGVEYNEVQINVGF